MSKLEDHIDTPDDVEQRLRQTLHSHFDVTDEVRLSHSPLPHTTHSTARYLTLTLTLTLPSPPLHMFSPRISLVLAPHDPLKVSVESRAAEDIAMELGFDPALLGEKNMVRTKYLRIADYID